MRNIFYVKGSEICPIQSLCGCLVMLWRPFVSSANIGKFPSNTSAYRVNTIYLHSDPWIFAQTLDAPHDEQHDEHFAIVRFTKQ